MAGETIGRDVAGDPVSGELANNHLFSARTHNCDSDAGNCRMRKNRFAAKIVHTGSQSGSPYVRVVVCIAESSASKLLQVIGLVVNRGRVKPQ
jgi:hypothetical protein